MEFETASHYANSLQAAWTASFSFSLSFSKTGNVEVWLVTDTGLNADRALKLIPPDKVPNPNNFFHEAQLLQEAEHPNVIQMMSCADSNTHMRKESSIEISNPATF